MISRCLKSASHTSFHSRSKTNPSAFYSDVVFCHPRYRLPVHSEAHSTATSAQHHHRLPVIALAIMACPSSPKCRGPAARSSIPIPTPAMKSNLSATDNPAMRDRTFEMRRNSPPPDEAVKTLRPQIRLHGPIPLFPGKENTQLSTLRRSPTAIMPAVAAAAGMDPSGGLIPAAGKEDRIIVKPAVDLGILRAVGVQLPVRDADTTRDEGMVVEMRGLPTSTRLNTKPSSVSTSVPTTGSSLASFEFPTRSPIGSVPNFTIPSGDTAYMSHLKPIEARPKLMSGASKASLTLLTTTPLTPTPPADSEGDTKPQCTISMDFPTAALYDENVSPADSRHSDAKMAADVTLMLHLRSDERRQKHGTIAKRMMHHRAESTVSVSSLASLHGSNLPGWEEFSTLPRDSSELTSFPKYQSNSMRSSSLKRISAKIMGDETGTGISGIGRFFTKVWHTRRTEPASRRNTVVWEDDADVSDAESRIIDLSAIAAAGRKSEEKDRGKTHSRAGSLVEAVKSKAIDIKGKAVERTRRVSTAGSVRPDDSFRDSKAGEVSRRPSKGSLVSATKSPTGSNSGISSSLTNRPSVGSLTVI